MLDLHLQKCHRKCITLSVFIASSVGATEAKGLALLGGHTGDSRCALHPRCDGVKLGHYFPGEAPCQLEGRQKEPFRV